MAQADGRSVAVGEQLRAAGLRPTRQRLAIAGLLLHGEHRHISAEGLLTEAKAAGVPVSQATIYNILRQFADAGLIREVLVESGRTWFDTRTSAHVHLFNESSGAITDIDCDPHALGLTDLLDLPADVRISELSIVVRVKQK